MALGQAIGTGAALFVGLGWDVVGPQQVAAATGAERLALYRLSLTSRLVALGPVAAISFLVGCLVSSSFRVETGLIAFGSAGAALTPQWYFIGINRPLAILLTDGLPRLLAAVIAAGLVLAGFPLIVFPLCIIAAVPLTLAITTWTLGARSIPERGDWAQTPQIIRHQSVVMWGRSLTFMFTSAPVILVGAFAPAALGAYSAADRLARMSVLVLRSFPSRLQSWLGAAHGSSDLNRKIHQVVLFQCVLGIVVWLVFALLAPSLANWVFAGQIEVSYVMSFLAGGVVGMISVGAGIGLGLVALGRASVITRGVVVGAVLATVGVPLAGRTMGAEAAMAAVLVAEFCCDAVQASALTGFLRSSPSISRERVV